VRRIIIFLFYLALSGCAHQGVQIPYTADLSTVHDPIALIKNTIEQQPSCAAMPTKVEVTKAFLRLYFVESPIFPFTGQSEKPLDIYYKNLEKLELVRSFDSKVWRIEIYDKLGSDLYWVYTLDESEAKRFYDALYFMMSKGC
jgi:hypothetical protein